MMSNAIWLDDVRNPNDKMWRDKYNLSIYDVFWCRNLVEFAQTLQKVEKVDRIFFDHDLGTSHFTGMDAAHYLVEWCEMTGNPLPSFEIQSSNVTGKGNITSLLTTYNKIRSID